MLVRTFAGKGEGLFTWGGIIYMGRHYLHGEALFTWGGIIYMGRHYLHGDNSRPHSATTSQYPYIHVIERHVTSRVMWENYSADLCAAINSETISLQLKYYTVSLFVLRSSKLVVLPQWARKDWLNILRWLECAKQGLRVEQQLQSTYLLLWKH